MSSLTQDIKLLEQFTIDTGVKISIQNFRRALKASTGLEPINIAGGWYYIGITRKDKKDLSLKHAYIL